MDIYIYLCVLFALSAIIEPALPIMGRRTLFVINGLILFVVVAGRTCGTDYWLYKSVIDTGNIENSEWPWLYQILTSYLPFQLVIALVALFTMLPFYLLIYKFAGKYVNFAAAFFFTEYFFMTLMQQARQGVALGFMVWAFFMYSSKKVKFALSNIIGAFVHLTGYFGLLPLFLKTSFYRPKTYIITYLVSLVFGGLIFNYLFDNISALGITILTSKFYGYMDRTEALDASTNIFSFKIFLLLSLIIYCYVKRAVIKQKVIPFLCNIVFFGVCFCTLFSPIVDIAVRGSFCFIGIYFFIFSILINENGLTLYHRRIIYFLSILYCLYLMTQNMNMVINQNIDLQLIPYTFM